LLKARLAELAAKPHRNFSTARLQRIFDLPRWVYATTALLAVATVVAFHFSTLSVGAATTPDAALTPGLVRSAGKYDLCSASASDSPAISATVAHEVFRQYGIRPQPRAYEVDYLITPALGGAHDVRNLWPQPYSAGTWNAHVKDALEDHLYRLVCQGDVDLAQAQRDISANWVAAYKKYFRSEHPLPHHVDFRKDAAWE
jgi:hypothetical protein